jgi:hypothetical protein
MRCRCVPHVGGRTKIRVNSGHCLDSVLQKESLLAPSSPITNVWCTVQAVIERSVQKTHKATAAIQLLPPRSCFAGQDLPSTGCHDDSRLRVWSWSVLRRLRWQRMDRRPGCCAWFPFMWCVTGNRESAYPGAQSLLTQARESSRANILDLKRHGQMTKCMTSI